MYLAMQKGRPYCWVWSAEVELESHFFDVLIFVATSGQTVSDTSTDLCALYKTSCLR